MTYSTTALLLMIFFLITAGIGYLMEFENLSFFCIFAAFICLYLRTSFGTIVTDKRIFKEKNRSRQEDE